MKPLPDFVIEGAPYLRIIVPDFHVKVYLPYIERMSNLLQKN
jgi:hypothetical protein